IGGLGVSGVQAQVSVNSTGPTVTGVSPAMIPYGVATEITIVGTNLDYVYGVSIDGNSPTYMGDFTSLSGNSLSLRTPVLVASDDSQVDIDLIWSWAGSSGTITLPDALTLYGTAQTVDYLVPDTTELHSGVARSFTTQLRDANGTPVPTSGQPIGITNSGVGTVQLPDDTTLVTDAAGQATVSVTGILAGTTTLTVSLLSTAASTQTSFVVAPGVAHSASMLQQPSPAAITGTPFDQQPMVQVVDAAGNLVDDSTAVTAVVASGSGTLTGTTTRSTNTGVVAFDDLSITGTGATTVEFQVGGVALATSSTITVTDPPAPPPAPAPPHAPAPPPALPPAPEPEPEVLAPPIIHRVEVGNAAVRLTWQPPPNADVFDIAGYLVEQSDSVEGAWAPATEGSIIADTQDVVTNLVNGTEYLFRVAAVSNGEPGEFAVLDDPVVPHQDAPALAAPDDTPKLGVPRPGVSVMVDPYATHSLAVAENLRIDAATISGSHTRWIMSTTTGNGLRQGTSRQGVILRAGGSLAMRGHGFLASSMISVHVRANDSEQAIHLGDVASDPKGESIAELRIPAGLPAGRYALYLTGLSPTGNTQHIAVGAQLKPDSDAMFLMTAEASGGRVQVIGQVTGSQVSQPLRPWLRKLGTRGFTPGVQRMAVPTQGEFSWQRKIRRPMVMQMRTRDGVISPNILLRPR
ncbi:MAG: fibronectin type III domain-containing protein, partial [Candidatus Nanopelagicales bacterium]